MLHARAMHFPAVINVTIWTRLTPEYGYGKAYGNPTWKHMHLRTRGFIYFPAVINVSKVWGYPTTARSQPVSITIITVMSSPSSSTSDPISAASRAPASHQSLRCGACTRTISRLAHLHRHQEKHQSSQRWPCQYCTNSYTRRCVHTWSSRLCLLFRVHSLIRAFMHIAMPSIDTWHAATWLAPALASSHTM